MRLRFTILLAMLLAAPVHAQSLEDAVRHFDDGNRLYRDGDFQSAVERYRDALGTGYANGALYYNLGNAYYRLDELGQAVRYYEKAGRFVSESPQLQHNLALVREQVADSFSRIPDPFWRTAWDRLVRLLTPAGLFLLGLVFYSSAAVAIGLRIRHGRSPWLRRAVLIGGTLGICFVLLGFTASYERANAISAVILVDEVTLLDRPDGSNADVQVHEGTVVDVVTSRADWIEIRLPNGVRGWMHSDAIGTI